MAYMSNKFYLVLKLMRQYDYRHSMNGWMITSYYRSRI